MKVMRGPLTTGSWEVTDVKEPERYGKSWRPGDAIRFDGTINKGGSRHTEFGVALDEADVLALHAGLIRHFKDCAKERDEELDELRRTVTELEAALEKISSLILLRADRAPDKEHLLDAVEEIASHFSRSWNRGKKFSSRHKWLRWRSL